MSTQPRLKVLIADDWTEIADSMATLVRVLGHDAIVAYDGAQAIEASASCPHVAFIDCVMPRANGFAVAREMRADATTARCYIVAMTCYHDASLARDAIAAGCDLFCVKPLSIGTVRDALACGLDMLAYHPLD